MMVLLFSLNAMMCWLFWLIILRNHEHILAQVIIPPLLQWHHNECNGISYHQSIICSTICSGTHQRKHQSSASLAFVRGSKHRWLVDSPHKGPVKRKMFPFDDIIMWWSGTGICNHHDDQSQPAHLKPLPTSYIYLHVSTATWWHSLCQFHLLTLYNHSTDSVGFHHIRMNNN